MPGALCTSPCLPWQQLPSPFPSSSPISLGLPPLRHSSLFSPLHPLSPPRPLPSKPRPHAFLCELVVQVDDVTSAEGQKSADPAPGSKIRVLGPLKVFHVPKHPDFDLGGCEGELKDVIKTWKGKPLSANLPYKVQFVLELDGKPVKFFAHLKANEFEVIG